MAKRASKPTPTKARKRSHWPASLSDRQIEFLCGLQSGKDYCNAWRDAKPERMGRPDEECRRGGSLEMLRLCDDPAHQRLLEDVVRRGTSVARVKTQILLNAMLDDEDEELRAKGLELNLERFSDDTAAANPYLDDEPIIDPGPEHCGEACTGKPSSYARR